MAIQHEHKIEQFQGVLYFLKVLPAEEMTIRHMCSAEEPHCSFSTTMRKNCSSKSLLSCRFTHASSVSLRPGDPPPPPPPLISALTSSQLLTSRSWNTCISCRCCQSCTKYMQNTKYYLKFNINSNYFIKFYY